MSVSRYPLRHRDRNIATVLRRREPTCRAIDMPPPLSYPRALMNRQRVIATRSPIDRVSQDHQSSVLSSNHDVATGTPAAWALREPRARTGHTEPVPRALSFPHPPVAMLSPASRHLLLVPISRGVDPAGRATALMRACRSHA